MAVMVVSIFQPNAIPFDQEELYNAAHARLLQLGHWQDWLDLQYRGHCGGCTQHALLGSALFAILGHSLFTWKLIPVLYIGLMAYAGARVLDRHFGGAATVIWGAILCLPAPTFLELSMTAWGNHVEAGVSAVVFIHAALRVREDPSIRNAGALGLILAWGLWIGFSAAFLILAALPILWRRVQPRAILAFIAGLSPVFALWAYQTSFAISGPFETIYYAGESTPRLGRIPQKVWSLIAPRQLVALFSDATMPGIGWAAALSIAVAAWTTRRHPVARVFFWAIGAFLAVYGTVRFTVWTPPAPEIAPPGSMRYAAPLYGLLWLVLAGAAGAAWQQRQRWLSCALILPSLVAGLSARADHLRAPFPDLSVLRMAAPDFLYARDQAAYSIRLVDHQSHRMEAQDGRDFQSFSTSWYAARSVLDHDPDAAMSLPAERTRAGLEGVGAALLPEVDGRGSGGLEALTLMDERLVDWPQNDRVRVLAEAARRRDWTEAYRSGHSQGGIHRFIQATSDLSAAVQRALTEDLGRRWASDLIRWRTQTPLAAPAVDGLAYPADFVRGYAEVTGRRLGRLDIAAPETLRLHAGAWESGLMYGVRVQWINQSH